MQTGCNSRQEYYILGDNKEQSRCIGLCCKQHIYGIMVQTIRVPLTMIHP